MNEASTVADPSHLSSPENQRRGASAALLDSKAPTGRNIPAQGKVPANAGVAAPGSPPPVSQAL